MENIYPPIIWIRVVIRVRLKAHRPLVYRKRRCSSRHNGTWIRKVHVGQLGGAPHASAQHYFHLAERILRILPKVRAVIGGDTRVVEQPTPWKIDRVVATRRPLPG